MAAGRITYCIIDETDPLDEFECEGSIVKDFFCTSPVFDRKASLALIRRKIDLERKLAKNPQKLFSIFHLAAHGRYFARTRTRLAFPTITGRRNGREFEILRPDSLVVTKLKADVLLSTCCDSFNERFIGVLRGYGAIRNYIAPVDDPQPGDTIVFALMFYNQLIRDIRVSQKQVGDEQIRKAFETARVAYVSYSGCGTFRLYNARLDRVHG